MNKLVDKLANDVIEGGARHAFGIPGSGPSLDLIDGFVSGGIHFHSTYFEGSAAIMAGVVGRLSGHPGICLSIKGPGLANSIPGLAVCAFENYPVLMFSEAYGLHSASSKVHKRIDHRSLTSSVVKRCVTLGDEQVFLYATLFASQEIPGPVLIELIESDESVVIANSNAIEHRNDYQNVTVHLEESKKPIVIVGSVGIRQNYSDYLSELDIPIFFTASAKGIVSESYDHVAGVYTGAGLERTPEVTLIEKADLVVGIGLRNTEVLVAKKFPCKAVNIDEVSHNYGQGFDFTEVGDISLIGDLINILREKQWGTEYVVCSKKTLRSNLLIRDFMPSTVFDIVQEYFGRSVRLVLDTGSFCTIGEHIWQGTAPNLYLSSGNSRYMGTCLPMAIGASFYDRSVPTVAAVGDGGIGMYISELNLAIAANLPILVLLFSDGGYGSIRARAILDGLDQSSLLRHGSRWPSVMEGLGLAVSEVDKEDDLVRALSQWNPQQGPCFIGCNFDPEKYQNMLEGLRH